MIDVSPLDTEAFTPVGHIVSSLSLIMSLGTSAVGPAQKQGSTVPSASLHQRVLEKGQTTSRAECGDITISTTCLGFWFSSLYLNTTVWGVRFTTCGG